MNIYKIAIGLSLVTYFSLTPMKRNQLHPRWEVEAHNLGHVELLQQNMNEETLLPILATLYFDHNDQLIGCDVRYGRYCTQQALQLFFTHQNEVQQNLPHHIILNNHQISERCNTNDEWSLKLSEKLDHNLLIQLTVIAWLYETLVPNHFHQLTLMYAKALYLAHKNNPMWWTLDFSLPLPKPILENYYSNLLLETTTQLNRKAVPSLPCQHQLLLKDAFEKDVHKLDHFRTQQCQTWYRQLPSRVRHIIPKKARKMLKPSITKKR